MTIQALSFDQVLEICYNYYDVTLYDLPYYGVNWLIDYIKLEYDQDVSDMIFAYRKKHGLMY